MPRAELMMNAVRSHIVSVLVSALVVRVCRHLTMTNYTGKIIKNHGILQNPHLLNPNLARYDLLRKRLM